jgi:ubiquinone/menaquinone biosynthesis C-methylase UbiE
MTALRFSTSTFTPFQAQVIQPAIVNKLAGTGPLQIAQACLSLSPPINSSSIVHDNGCGDGNVTRVIVSGREKNKYPSKIYATDIAGKFLELVTSEAREKGWPVETALMPAQKLDYPDNTFTHSIMNCVILRLSDSDAIKACSEMYRTLKPGGVGVVSGWADLPHRAALAAAHTATR